MCLIAETAEEHLDSMDVEGRTSLMRAARDGQEAVVRTLICKKANVNAEDSEGRTALMMAAGCSLILLRMLLRFRCRIIPCASMLSVWKIDSRLRL